VRRLAVARLWHEGNSFSPAITELEHFRQRESSRQRTISARHFAPVLSATVEVDAPGPAALDLTRLPFRYAPAYLYRGASPR